MKTDETQGEKELTRWDKIIAVCYLSIDELENAGLITLIGKRSWTLTPKGRKEIAQWEDEENFTEQEIREGMDSLISEGLFEFRV